MSKCESCSLDKAEYKQLVRDSKISTENAIKDYKQIQELKKKLKEEMAAKGPVGSIEPYFEDATEWNVWIERLELYFAANRVDDSLKVLTFLTLLGEQGYVRLRNLCVPDKPSTKTFKELTELMKKHTQPEPSEIPERFKFYRCFQGEGESVSEFCANLKKVATHCKFGDNLNYHLRDQFLSGIRCESIKKMLLEEDSLTFEVAVKKALANKMAARDTAELAEGVNSIHFVKGRKQQAKKKAVDSRKKPCIHRGYTNHIAEQRKDNGHADCLSRLPLGAESDGINTDDYSYLKYVSESVDFISPSKLVLETANCGVLTQVRKHVKYGWPEVIEKDLKPYKRRASELALENGCILWGHRLIVPKSLQPIFLKELHSGHMGVVKMKALACSYIWWPRIDEEIEKITKQCELCSTHGPYPPRSELHVWDWPDAPNKRLHADFLGPIGGRMDFIITDAHSKWVDVQEMRDISAKSTIDAFKLYFATWGLPIKIVTDNGPAFISQEFRKFTRNNNIDHHLVPPYHPASNGAAENAVKTFKNKFKILLLEKLNRKDALAKYLFQYRSTPHVTTGVTPAELQMGRKFFTRFDLLKLNTAAVVNKSQEAQKKKPSWQ
ncbi:uncharacterized protein K02A2.6-like [Copidosoma floridanum]|uniref:uncharacterized protein K02A2.6-like n=1 Tax=Copidosoma floridanum TaxID=29053 RepID=UPI0006C98719|nr:uncharacterized protein K02A2.6-like [Copidosoma floridanum]